MRDVQSIAWRTARDPSEPILYVVRHGETELNAANQFRGFTDVELDRNGYRQAYEARDVVDHVAFKHAYSSDLRRAALTLDIVLGIAKDTEAVAQRLAAMRPWNIGDFAGMQKSEKNKAALHSYSEHPSVPLPGGESLDWFRSRYQHFFSECVKEALESGGPTLLAQHASNNHEIGNIIYGDIDTLDVDPGGVIAVYFVPPQGLEARALKGQSHTKQESYS